MPLKNRLKIAHFLNQETQKMISMGSINKPTDLLNPESYKNKLPHFERMMESNSARVFSDHPLIRLFETYTKTATIAQHYKICNCGNHARLAFKLAFMMRAGPLSLYISTKGSGHEMLIIGKTKTEEDRACAIIVDPYFDEYYPFNDYLKSQAYKDTLLGHDLYTQYSVFFPERDELFAFFINALTPEDRAELSKYQKIKEDILASTTEVEPKINAFTYQEQIKQSYSETALLSILKELAQNLAFELENESRSTIRLYVDMIPSILPLCRPNHSADIQNSELLEVYTACEAYLKSSLDAFLSASNNKAIIIHSRAASEMINLYCELKQKQLASIKDLNSSDSADHKNAPKLRP